MDDTGRGVTNLNPKRDVLPAENDAVDAVLAAAGDSHAFERLYRRHLGRIHSLARRMINPEEADDATQAVFIRAWEKLGTFRGEAAFGTWLHRLAINVMLARRTTIGTERGRFSEAEGVVERMTGRPSQKDLSMDFEEAIERLPNGAREVFVLHDVEGYKHEEIAGMLGIVTGTSKAQLHRARMALRGYLER
jgi:RNA polymerase sigma-70 factor (ECF subfamily)